MFSFFRNRKRIAELESEVWRQTYRADTWRYVAQGALVEISDLQEELAKFKRERGPDGKFRKAQA